MDNKIGLWLQIAANIGILVGLIAVWFQMRQEHELAAVELKSDSYRQIYEWQLTLMGDDPSRSLAKLHAAPETLTEYDVTVLNAYINSELWMARRMSYLEENGLYDDDWRHRILPSLAYDFGGNPVTRDWFLSSNSDDPVVKEIIELMSSISPNTHNDRLQNRWMKPVRELIEANKPEE